MWKDIPGYESQYEINELGVVRSKYRKITNNNGSSYALRQRVLKPNRIANGYNIVHLCKNGVRKAVYIHRLVAELFVDNLSGLGVVNHIDGDKDNCRSDNLEWVSYSDNNKHAYDSGLKPKGELFYNAKLSQQDVEEIRANGKYDTYRNIGNKYNVSGATIRDVLLCRTWRRA